MRTRPYTDAGLTRVPCTRCGAPSRHQWSLRPCAIGQERWYGLCEVHDLELNRLTLEFMRVSDSEALLAAYEARR